MLAGMTDPHVLPADLPAPADDGACVHLPGLRWPTYALRGTDGAAHDLSVLPRRTVVYAYPKTARPDQAMPEDWDLIPGARGCTPQSCTSKWPMREAAAQAWLKLRRSSW